MLPLNDSRFLRVEEREVTTTPSSLSQSHTNINQHHFPSVQLMFSVFLFLLIFTLQQRALCTANHMVKKNGKIFSRSWVVLCFLVSPTNACYHLCSVFLCVWGFPLMPHGHLLPVNLLSNAPKLFFLLSQCVWYMMLLIIKLRIN